MAVVAEVSSVLAGAQEVEQQLSAGAMGSGHWALAQRSTGCVLSVCRVCVVTPWQCSLNSSAERCPACICVLQLLCGQELFSLSSCARGTRVRPSALLAWSAKPCTTSCRKEINSSVAVIKSSLSTLPKISASLPRMKFDFSFHLAAWRNLSLPPCPLCTSFPYREHFFYFQKQNPKLKSVCNDLLSPQTMFFNPHYDFLSPTKKAKIFPIQLLFHSCPSPVLGPAEPHFKGIRFSFDFSHCLPKHSSAILINLLQISQKQYQTKLCTCSLPLSLKGS